MRLNETFVTPTNALPPPHTNTFSSHHHTPPHTFTLLLIPSHSSSHHHAPPSSHNTLYLQDFADVIPGHGGLMDRFDCQILMATFANVYYFTFCRYGCFQCTQTTTPPQHAIPIPILQMYTLWYRNKKQAIGIGVGRPLYCSLTVWHSLPFLGGQSRCVFPQLFLWCGLE